MSLIIPDKPRLIKTSAEKTPARFSKPKTARAGAKSRLTPRNQIVFLNNEEKGIYRAQIELLNGIYYKIEAGTKLNAQERFFCVNQTGSENTETWMEMAEDRSRAAEEEYYGKLCAMAQHDLAAYIEFMTPEEIPVLHHLHMIEKLEALERGDLRTYFLSISPGAAKSTIASRKFIQWAMGRNPSWSVLGCGYAAVFSDNEFSKVNRDVLVDERYAAVFPDVTVDDESFAVGNWKLLGHKGKYYSRGAGAGISGIRANLTNIDDPIGTKENAESPGIREKQWQWLVNDVLPRRLPNNRLMIIATRWHTGDLIGRAESLYKKNPKSLIGPVHIENISAKAGENDPLGRVPGQWLWTGEGGFKPFYSAEHYENLELLMEADEFSSLYMGIPLDEQGGEITTEDFKKYNENPKPEDIIKTTLSIDTALKSTQRSDYTAITVWSYCTDGKHYLRYAERTKNSITGILKLIVSLVNDYGASAALIEDAAMGAILLEAQNSGLGAGIPFLPVSPHKKGSKEFAFDKAIPHIRTGKFLFPERAAWWGEYYRELKQFPFGDNDDYVDSTSQYVNANIKIRRGGTKKMTMKH